MKQNGFSLIELLVVASISVVIAIAGLVSYRNATQKSRDTKRVSTLEQVRSALEMYRTDVGNYPGTLGGLSDYTSVDMTELGYSPDIANFSYCIGVTLENSANAPSPATDCILGTYNFTRSNK